MVLHKARECLTFTAGFFRNPGRNGSLIPSSRSLTAAMIAGIPWERVGTLVELGPGVGTFTGAIMASVRPGTRVILVEANPAYAIHLRERYRHRLVVETASAAELDLILSRHGVGRPDCIISGLPLASLPVAVSERIAGQIQGHIRQGTIYRSFTYRPARTLQFFGAGVLTYQSRRIWMNFPPAFVLGAP